MNRLCILKIILMGYIKLYAHENPLTQCEHTLVDHTNTHLRVLLL